MLIASRIPHSSSGPDHPSAGSNRFECRTCPYEFVLEKKGYYERKIMRQKAVADVLGGEDAWKNVDVTDGK